MPKITVRRDGALVSSFTVHDKQFVIGSAQNSAVYIDDVGLPPQAAEISSGESGYTLKRLSPIPDLQINGTRVDQYAEINDLDEIKLDDYILNFNLLDEELQTEAPPEAPAEAAPVPPVESEAAPEPAQTEPPPPVPPAQPEPPAPAPVPPAPLPAPEPPAAAAPPPAPQPPAPQPPPPPKPEPPAPSPPQPAPPKPEPPLQPAPPTSPPPAPKPQPPAPEPPAPPPPKPPEPPRAYPKTVMQDMPVEPPSPSPPPPKPPPAPAPPPARPPKSDKGRKTKVLDEGPVPAAPPGPPPPPPQAARPSPRPVPGGPSADHEATQFAGHVLSERLALLVIGGPMKGERFILQDGETKIGRDPNQNDVVIRFDAHGDVDTSISRQHCTITNENGVYMLRDPLSKTRTMHNGKVLKPEEAMALQPGDTVEVRSLHENTSFRVVREGEWDVPERTLREEKPPRRKAPWWKRLLPLLVLVLLAGIVAAWALAGPAPDRSHEVKFEQAAAWPAPAGIKSATGAFLALGDSAEILVYADNDGNLQWWRNGESYHAATLGLRATDFPMLALDANQDGNDDVILDSDDHYLYYYDGVRGARLGATEWFVEPFGTPPSATLTAKPSGLVAVHSDHGGLAVYRAADAATFRSGAYYNGRMFGAGAFLDCNHDGVEDYVAGTDDGQVNWIDGVSGEMETVDVRDAAAQTKPELKATAMQIRGAIAGWDFTADGYIDWVILTRQGHLLIIDRRQGRLLAYHEFEQPRGALPTRYPGPMLADLDKDGIPEIIVPLYSGELHALRIPRTAGGAFSEFWPAVSTAGFKYEPALVDLNGDRSPEVVACDTEGTLIVVDGATGKTLYRAGLGISGDPLVADVDGDGEVELMAAAGSKWAVVRTGVGAEPSTTWPQWRGDIGRHGMFQTPPPRTRRPWPTTLILGTLALAAVILWVKR